MLGLRLTRWLRQRLGFTADARGVLGSALIVFVVGGDPPDRRGAPGEQFLKTVRLTLRALLAGSQRDGGPVLAADAGIVWTIAGGNAAHCPGRPLQRQGPEARPETRVANLREWSRRWPKSSTFMALTRAIARMVAHHGDGVSGLTGVISPSPQ